MKIRRNDAEHQSQVILFDWATRMEWKYPQLRMMFAIANGGARHIAVARKLKAEGVKAGVPDICLPVPRGNYAGLWIEMKAGKNKPTELQEDWQERLRMYGHRVTVCYGWEEARDVLLDYLSVATYE